MDAAAGSIRGIKRWLIGMVTVLLQFPGAATGSAADDHVDLMLGLSSRFDAAADLHLLAGGATQTVLAEVRQTQDGVLSLESADRFLVVDVLLSETWQGPPVTIGPDFLRWGVVAGPEDRPEAGLPSSPVASIQSRRIAVQPGVRCRWQVPLAAVFATLDLPLACGWPPAGKHRLAVEVIDPAVGEGGAALAGTIIDLVVPERRIIEALLATAPGSTSLVHQACLTENGLWYTRQQLEPGDQSGLGRASLPWPWAPAALAADLGLAAVPHGGSRTAPDLYRLVGRALAAGLDPRRLADTVACWTSQPPVRVVDGAFTGARLVVTAADRAVLVAEAAGESLLIVPPLAGSEDLQDLLTLAAGAVPQAVPEMDATAAPALQTHRVSGTLRLCRISSDGGVMLIVGDDTAAQMLLLAADARHLQRWQRRRPLPEGQLTVQAPSTADGIPRVVVSDAAGRLSTAWDWHRLPSLQW